MSYAQDFIPIAEPDMWNGGEQTVLMNTYYQQLNDSSPLKTKKEAALFF